MKKNGIDCRQMINPVNHAKYLLNKDKKNIYKNCQKISKQSVHLPSSTNLKFNQIVKICKSVERYLI